MKNIFFKFILLLSISNFVNASSENKIEKDLNILLEAWKESCLEANTESQDKKKEELVSFLYEKKDNIEVLIASINKFIERTKTSSPCSSTYIFELEDFEEELELDDSKFLKKLEELLDQIKERKISLDKLNELEKKLNELKKYFN